MVWKRGAVAVLFVSLLFLMGAGREPEGPERGRPGPADEVRRLLDNVLRLAETREKEGAGAEAEAGISREISASFDLTGICKNSLRATWDTLSEEERGVFVRLFQELLEKVAYPRSSDFFKGTEVEVEGVSRRGATVQVETVVEHEREGMVEVTFFMGEVDGRWLVQDIHLDGVSLGLDIRSQMQRILREHSYEELRRRLRERIEEG